MPARELDRVVAYDFFAGRWGGVLIKTDEALVGLEDVAEIAWGNGGEVGEECYY